MEATEFICFASIGPEDSLPVYRAELPDDLDYRVCTDLPCIIVAPHVTEDDIPDLLKEATVTARMISLR
jgi:hypothetical protein